jgi:hypothetical protein
MKALFAIVFSALLVVAPTQKAEASAYVTSTVVGVVVANFAGAGAGVAASLLLAGSALVVGGAAAKEQVAQAALNDVQDYYLNGNLSIALENSINDIMALDENISEEEALDMIVQAMTE